MNANGSQVVDAMRQAVQDTRETWRQHVERGTASSPEGLEAFDAYRLASATWLGEVVGRAELRGARRAA